jgi:hypothetical protein
LVATVTADPLKLSAEAEAYAQAEGDTTLAVLPN